MTSTSRNDDGLDNQSLELTSLTHRNPTTSLSHNQNNQPENYFDSEQGYGFSNPIPLSNNYYSNNHIYPPNATNHGIPGYSALHSQSHQIPMHSPFHKSLPQMAQGGMAAGIAGAMAPGLSSAPFTKEQMQSIITMIKTRSPQEVVAQASSYSSSLYSGFKSLKESVGDSPTTVVGTILSVGGSLSAKFAQVIHWPKIENCPDPSWASLLLLIAFALIFGALTFVITVAVGRDPKQLSASMNKESKARRIWNAFLCAITIFSFTLGFLFLNDTVNHCLPGSAVDPADQTVDWDLLGTLLIAITIGTVVIVKVGMMVFWGNTRAYLLGIVSAAASVGANALLSSSTTINADPVESLKHTVTGSQACMSFLTEETNKPQATPKIQTNCLAFAAGTSLISSYAGIFAVTEKDDTEMIRSLSTLSSILFTHVGEMNLETIPDPETLKKLITLALFPRAGKVISMLSRKKQLKFKGLDPVVKYQLAFSKFMNKCSSVEPIVNKLVKECHTASISLGLEGMRFCDEHIDDKLQAIENTLKNFLPTRVTVTESPLVASSTEPSNNSWFKKLGANIRKNTLSASSSTNQPLEAGESTSLAPSTSETSTGEVVSSENDEDDSFGPMVVSMIPIFGFDTRSRYRIASLLEKTAAGQFLVEFCSPFDQALPDIQKLGSLFNVTPHSFHDMAEKIRSSASDSPLQTIVRRLILHVADDCFDLASAPSMDEMYETFYRLLLSELALRKITPIQLSPDIHPSLYGLLCKLADSTNPDIFDLIERFSSKLGPVASPLATVFFFELCDVHKPVPKSQFRNLILSLAPERTRPMLKTMLGHHGPFRLDIATLAHFFGVPVPNIVESDTNPLAFNTVHDNFATLISNILRLKMGSNSGRLFIRMLDRVITQRFAKDASFDGLLTTRKEFEILFPTVDFDKLATDLDSIQDVRLRNIIRNVSLGHYDAASALLNLTDLAGKNTTPFNYLYSLFPQPLVKLLLSSHPSDSNLVLDLNQFAEFVKTLIPSQFHSVLEFYFFQKRISTREIATILNAHVDSPLFSEFLQHFTSSNSIISSTTETLSALTSEALRRLHNKAHPVLSNLSVFGLNSREITKLSRELFGSLTPFRSLLHLLGDAVRWRLIELKPTAPKVFYQFGLDLGPPGAVIDWDDSFRSEFGLIGKKPSFQPLQIVRTWDTKALWLALSLTADHHQPSTNKICHRMYSLKFDVFYQLFLDQVVTAITQLSKKLKRGILKLESDGFKIPFAAFGAGVKAATDYVHTLNSVSEGQLLQNLINYTYGVSILSTQISLGKPSMNDDDLLKIGSATLTGIIRVYQTIQKKPFLETADIIKEAFSGDMDYTIEPQSSFLATTFGSRDAQDLLEDVESAFHTIHK